MELSPTQQAFELIKKSKKILIIVPPLANGDAIGGALALSMGVQKLGEKEISFVSPDHVPENLVFLPGSSHTKNILETSREFVISVDLSCVRARQLRYNTKGNRLNIYIQPEEGSFKKEDVKSSQGKFQNDLIITTSLPDLEALGKMYDNNAEFFYEVPILNIDHHSGNDNYGQVNLVDITASSSSEIIADLLETLGEEAIDEDIATCLLAGITAATQSFQTSKTSPKTLTLAANLITRGADQKKIVYYLYKSRSMKLLKLFGRALARIQQDKENKITWSLLSVNDFKRTDASGEDVPRVLKEIAEISADQNIIMLLLETKKGEIKGILRVGKGIDKEKIRVLLNGSLYQDFVTFHVKENLIKEVEKEILEKLRGFLRDLNI